MDEIHVALITLTGVAITAFVTWSIAQRRIAARHVTAERTKWRQDVRAKALLVHDAILRGEGATVDRLNVEFRALLNPFDRHDQELLKSMAVKELHEAREETANKFANRIALLLKHDWERAKLEASVFLYRWYLDVRRWGLDWDQGNAVNGPGPIQWMKRWARNRRACKGLWWCEKYKIRWIRAVVSAAILGASWYWTRLGSFMAGLLAA